MAADTTRERRPEHRGMAAACRALVRAEGFVGLYRGLGVSMVEIAPYIAISFGGEIANSYSLSLSSLSLLSLCWRLHMCSAFDHGSP